MCWNANLVKMGVEKGGCMCIAGFLWLFVTSLSASSSDPRRRASAFCKSIQTIVVSWRRDTISLPFDLELFVAPFAFSVAVVSVVIGFHSLPKWKSYSLTWHGTFDLPCLCVFISQLKTDLSSVPIYLLSVWFFEPVRRKFFTVMWTSVHQRDIQHINNLKEAPVGRGAGVGSVLWVFQGMRHLLVCGQGWGHVSAPGLSRDEANLMGLISQCGQSDVIFLSMVGSCSPFSLHVQGWKSTVLEVLQAIRGYLPSLWGL